MRNNIQRRAWRAVTERGNLHRLWWRACGTVIVDSTIGRAKGFRMAVARGHAVRTLGNCGRGPGSARSDTQVKHVTPNNAFERTAMHRGSRLAAARSSWLAAQLGR